MGKDSGIKGIGNDIVKIIRIEKAIEKYGDRFLNRIFTTSEKKYCLDKSNPALHFAGRFAAKEAVAKAFGTGLSKGINWTDIEIVNHRETGQPFVLLSQPLIDRFFSPTLFISISHCDEYATAFALWST